MKEHRYLDNIEQLMETLKKGAFLTVQSGKRLNTMTIGWAAFGHVWRKNVLMVAVRDSRYTFELIENSGDFTVTIPKDGGGKDALAFCGTKSGRDHDKFAACSLKTRPGSSTASPVIDIPGVHYECKIIYKSAMDPDFLDSESKKLYPAQDYHTLYFGEILACYQTD
jgi:flavin reductase (DIM6/NTAB) family NADH-FMN oxidoreductase RutF